MRQFFGLTIVAVLAATLAAAASADSAYRTERLELRGLSGARGGGMVVNVHPNGPIVYAHEIYALRGAVAGTYQVALHIFPASLTCSGASFVIPTATIETNAHGNGEADVKFTPADAAGIRGLTLSINWTVTGPATYVTDCTVVTLD
ncbi:MAG: hypothetical protein M3O92_04455 [Actinomycetota bacterium]|nr:hypothetical protein [Actinomycetota bacterium]